MKTRRLRNIIFIIGLAATLLVPAQRVFSQSNAGFAPGNIWYSPDQFEEGDKVRIYTIVFNPEQRELSGTVIFFDNNVFLGKKDFSVPPKGVKDVYMEWTVTVGSHNIFGKIENAKFLVSPGKYEEVFLAENETTKSSRTVSKKVVEEDVSIPADVTKIVNVVNSIPFGKIGDVVAEKTPGFIASPVISAASGIDELRFRLGSASENKKIEVRDEIKELDSAQTSSGESEEPTENGLLKPFKYTELFALALFSGVFNNKYIFYALLALITFLLLRYIVNRVR